MMNSEKQLKVIFKKYEGGFINSYLNEIVSREFVWTELKPKRDILIPSINPSYRKNETKKTAYSFDFKKAVHSDDYYNKFSDYLDVSKANYTDLLYQRHTEDFPIVIQV